MPTPTKLDAWIAALLAVAACLIFYPFASIGVDPHHDGIMLKPALDVMSGQVLFRDTFSQYGPLTTYLQASVLCVQPTLLSLRLLTVAAYAGSLGLLYLAWRSLLPRLVALTAVLLFIVSIPFFIPYVVMIPWSSTLALFFQSFALLALMRLVAGASPGVWAWVLGGACACTLWCRQPVGIILTGSVAVIAVGLHFTGWRHPHGTTVRIGSRVAAGFAAVTVLIVGYLAINGAFFAWWEQNVIWPRRWAAVAGANLFPSIARFWFIRIEVMTFILVVGLALAPTLLRRFYAKIPPVVDLAWWVLLAVLYLVIAKDWVRTALLIEHGGWRPFILGLIVLQSLFVFFRAIVPPQGGHPEWYYQVAVLSGISLGSAAQIYPMPCVDHVFWALAPGFGLLVWFIYKILRLSPARFMGVFLLLLAPAGYEKCRQAGINTGVSRDELGGVLSGLREEPAQAAAIARVQGVVGLLLARNSNQSVILYGDDALYLTWFNNSYNPSPYYVAWNDVLTPSEASKRMDYLVNQRPVLILNGSSASRLTRLPKDYELLINEPLLDLRIMAPRQISAGRQLNFDAATPIR